jgi:hypothetical protein
MQRDHIRTIRRTLQHLKIQSPEGVKSVDGSVWTGTVMQQCNPLRHQSLAFCLNSWSQQHLTVIDTVYYCGPLLTVFQSWYMRVKEKCQHHFP